MTDIRSFFNKNKKKAPPDRDKDDLPGPSRATDDYVSDDDFSTNANESNIPLDSSAVDTAVDTIDTVVPSINDLLLTKDQWIKSDNHKTSNSPHLSRSKMYAKNKKFDHNWLKIYPWLCPIKDGRTIIGVVCQVCRSSTSEFNVKSGGVWVSTPFTNFGKLTEKAKKHEFGTSKQILDCHDPVKFRKEVVDGTRQIPNTDHMKKYLDQVRHSLSIEASIEVANSKDMESLNLNRQAMLMLIAVIHWAVIRHDSPFASVKDTILFNIKIMGCSTLERLLTNERGISMRMIGELIVCIDRIVLLGIYQEMCAGLKSGEVIVFSGMIDNGSKTKKTKEYAGVGVKFSTPSGSTSRVISFKRCERKDGATLCQVLLDCYQEFNDEIALLKRDMGNLFPVKINPLPILDVHNQESLAVDGALISKEKQLNKRILQHNPRCIVTWCCDHRANLVAKDSIEAHQYETLHNVSVKLYELVNSSARVNQLFKQVQVMTGKLSKFCYLMYFSQALKFIHVRYYTTSVVFFNHS